MEPWTRLVPSFTKLGLLFQKCLGDIHKGTHAVTCYIAISFSPKRAEVRLEHESTPALTLKMMRLCVSICGMKQLEANEISSKNELPDTY
jgi:hypothetical protein